MIKNINAVEKNNTHINAMKQEFLIKLRIFDDRIIFNSLLHCCCSSTLKIITIVWWQFDCGQML